ncbi:DUF7093 family protein [Halostella salina]|uniref:DUF7093 family protein n=1 Tax=Halostella salina TaxID=1547897 RepID=UPI000EF7E183|nr:hypothetical protein [Halostella salina]
MGLRCSLLGHDFAETEVEREREEQGSEVIETVREVEVCARCGETTLVSENTNVTTLDAGDTASGAASDAAAVDEPAADDATEGTPADPATADSSPDPADSTPDDAATGDPAEPVGDGEDAEIIDETAAEPDAADSARTDTAEDVVTDAEGAAGPEPEAAPEEDDGVILDEDDEPAADREYGQWPDADDTGEPEGSERSTAWPEQEGEDRGYDAELSDEEADVEFGGGLTPEADPDAAPADGEETVGGGTEETGITSAATAPPPDAPADTTEVDTEFFCPECGQVTPAARSSLRAGDICPECKHGYITERER